MRLPAERALRLVALTVLLLGAPALARAPQDAAAKEPRSGPAADYPVVVGEPFTIGSTTYKPVDQLNYDAVGMAVIGEGAGHFGYSGLYRFHEQAGSLLPVPNATHARRLA